MEAIQTRGPNFFVVGAPKTGSTSLYYVLRQHPDIYMSPMKEPTYFAQEMRAENFVPELRGAVQRQIVQTHEALAAGEIPDEMRGIVTSSEDYQKLFAAARDERAVGEASVCYLWSKSAPGLIAECVPDAKLLVVLRNPAERAFSQYRSYAAAEGKPQSFREHIEESLALGDRMSPANPLLQFGMYAEQLERYYGLFAKEQVRVWLYEDTVADPARFYREIFEFLEVDAFFSPGPVAPHKRVTVLRAPGATRFLRDRGTRELLRNALPVGWVPAVKKALYKPQKSETLSAEDRRYLADYYRDDVTRLAEMLGRDLSRWLS